MVITVLKTSRKRGIRNVEGRREAFTVLIDLGRPWTGGHASKYLQKKREFTM